METTQTETQGTASSKAYDLDAMGLGPPTKVRRRGKVDKWTRILGVAVVLLLVFNVGVRMGHASRPKAAAPAGGAGAGAGGAGAGAGATAGTGAGGGGGAAGAAKPAATGTIKVVDGNTIYVGQPDGTTRKVTVNDSTRFTRTVPVELRDMQPGDRVTVEGPAHPDGGIDAVRIDGQASTLQQR
jgi:hypothetical protein